MSGQEQHLTAPASEDNYCQVVETGQTSGAQTESSHDTQAETIIHGSDLTVIGGEPESVLDDDPVSELSKRFVDLLDMPAIEPPLVRENAQHGSELEQETNPSPEELTNFNDAMTTISAFAEDVVKTWFAQIYDRPLSDVFPDGLTNNIGSVTILPDENMIRTRRRARIGHDEEVRDDDMHEDDSAGWELKLSVVDNTHRTNLDEWKMKEPVVLQHMQGLLKMAWGYINYAIESYGLPDKHLFVSNIYPSPWGTLYIHGAPETVPQIGVTITRIQPPPASS